MEDGMCGGGNGAVTEVMIYPKGGRRQSQPLPPLLYPTFLLPSLLVFVPHFFHLYENGQKSGSKHTLGGKKGNMKQNERKDVVGGKVLRQYRGNEKCNII